MNNPLTIPLVLLAAELGADTDRLAARLGDDVQVDAVGLRVVEAPVARHLFTERAERKAAEARRRAEWAERYRELDARMKAQLRGGIPATPGGSALADLMGGEQR